MAGALQDHKRAILVGENTYGKGSVQSIIPLNNNGAIRLTVSKYYLPSGKSISEVGVRPDIEVYEEGDNFKIKTVSNEMTLQKLTNRCINMYVNDEDFRNKVENDDKLSISGSSF